MAPSSPAAATFDSSRLKATARYDRSGPSGGPVGAPVAASSRASPRSKRATATRRPPASNATSRMPAGDFTTVASPRPVSASQSLTSPGFRRYVIAPTADTTRVPSGLNRAAMTGPAPACIVATSAPVSGSQTLASPGPWASIPPLAETMRPPSRRNSMVEMAVEWPR